MIVQSALSKHTANVNTSTERLATGFRINRPSDDSAGYVYSEKLDSQIRGIDVSQRNINDGIALLDTADSALTTVVDNLQRIRELVVEAAGGGQTDPQLDASQIEINELVDEIDDLNTNTQFNGRNLLDGTFSINLQIGPNANDTYAIDFSDTNPNDDEKIHLTTSTFATGVGAELADEGDIGFGAGMALYDISLSPNVQDRAGTIGGLSAGGTDELTALDQMISNLSGNQAVVAAKRNRLSSEFNYLTDQKFNLESAKSNVMDADIALESTKLTVNQVLQQSAVTLLAQANAAPNLALALIP